MSNNIGWRTPAPNPLARTHEMAIYVSDVAKPALYCRKCGRTVFEFNNVAGLDEIDYQAKEHRAEMRKK